MFILSVFLVILSSYLLLSGILSKKVQTKKGKTEFLYFLLIAFSQIVLSFEVLSILKSISKNGFLICNIIFLIISMIFFIRRGKTFYKPLFELKKFFSSLKRDKIILYLSICFVLFCIFQLISIFAFPVTFGDALAYYLPRCTAWIQYGSINHYITPDTRELIMPVNMEFLYTWVLMFTKNETGVAVFSYIGFIGGIYVLFNMLRELNFSIRRCLWAVFVFSSFALVIIEMVTPCADLFIGTLILASVYLYIKFLKYDDNQALYFSSLSYALAVGTKTTSIIAIPSVFIIFCILTHIYKKEKFIKNIFSFCGLFLLNFLVFSSYNYILNIIQFHNPVSSADQMLVNQFTGGIKGYFANCIKYCFAIFDMSGMPEFINNISGLIEYWQTLVLTLFGTTIRDGASNYFAWRFEFNNKMSMMQSALGVMGLFVFLPSLIYAIKRNIRKKMSKNAITIGVLAFSVLFNILLFSRVMVFTGYNMRYLLTFVIIASPVIVYSYSVKKCKLFKIFLCFVMFLYFIGYAHHKPISYILHCLTNKKIEKQLTTDEEHLIYKYFINKANTKIALMSEQVKSPSFYIEKLRLKNIKTDKILAENIESYDLNNFDYIITLKEKIASSNIINFEDRLKYPSLYVSKCIYNDYNQDTIYNFEKGVKPAVVECEIPFAYLKEKGFVEDENYKGEKYTILKKIHINR